MLRKNYSDGSPRNHTVTAATATVAAAAAAADSFWG